MSIEVTELLQGMEADPSPIDEQAFFAPLQALAQRFIDREIAVPTELTAEQIAFLVYAMDHGGESTWGLYFGPMMSGLTASGEPWETPSLRDMTAEILMYWAERAHRCTHPVMRARYADLLWEVPKKLEGLRRDVAMGLLAIDSYLEASDSRRYDDELTRIAKVRRALEIALTINAAQRIDRARDLLLALDDGTADDGDAGLWGFAFDVLLDPPNDRVGMSAEQIAHVVGGLEARLARLVAAPPTPYHPVATEAAATRLARHYRRIGRRGDMVRVLEAYGEAIKAMRGTGPSFLVAHSLEQLYHLYQSFGMRSQADALNELLRTAGEQSIKDMKSISVEVPLDQQAVEKHFSNMLNGTAAEVLARIAAYFIPDRTSLEVEMRAIAQQAVLSYLIPRVIKDDDGRTIARVGPLDADSEGRLVQHIAQHLNFNIPWLRESFARGIESELITPSAISDFLYTGPLYQAKRRAVIEAGLRWYVASDALAAIHILIPQLEQAVRELAAAIGAPIYAQRRGGGLNLRTLDALLRDRSVADVLGPNIASYLHILLTDVRGWNLRNNVCHGLASASMLSMPIADRVVHAMLVLALFRKQDDATAERSAAPANQAG